MYKMITSSLMVTLLTAACVDTKFRGEGAQKRSETSAKPNTPNTVVNPNNPTNTSTTPTVTDDPNDLPNPNGNGVPWWDKLLEPELNPNGNPFFLTWGGLGKIWHIGANGWDYSSCHTRLTFRFIVNAREFNYNFEVLEDNTTIKASVKYCGTDFPGSKIAIVSASGAPAGSPTDLNLTVNEKYQYGEIAAVTLNRGWYKVKVTSIERDMNPDPNNYAPDLDDFLVGRVNLDPNKAIRKGDITKN